MQDLLVDWRMHYPDAGLTLTLSGALDGLGDDLSTAVYRIVQEAVSNALRHAQASRIEVNVQTSAESLELEVIDNGHGNVDQFHSPGHFGVLGMRERAQASGGNFNLEQIEPSGARVRVVLPLRSKQESRAN